MTTVTLNVTSNSGYLQSSGTAYATAQAGAVDFTGANIASLGVGQQLASGTYHITESFLEFDTSSIPAGATINSVELSLWGSFDGSDTTCVIESRLHDYGSSFESGDWVATTTLSGLTRLATFDTSTGFSTSAYNTFTEDGTNFRNNINAGGMTRVVVVSNRVVSGTQPTGSERVVAVGHGSATSSEWPKLVIDYADPTQVVTPTTIASAEAFGTATFVLPFIQDDFNDNSLDTGKWTAWNTGASVAETNHTLVVTPAASAAQYGGLNSNNRFSLIGKRASVQLLQELNAGSSETDLWLYLDDNNKVGIQVTGTVIQAYKDVAGTESWTDALTYDSAVHRYLGFSESGGTLVWEYSTDGAAWTTIRSESVPFSVTSLEYRIFAGTWDASNANPGAAIFDNVNLLPTYLTPTSIASAESFGLTTIRLGANITPTSIPSSEAFGTAVLTTLSTLLASEINSGESFGRAVLTPGVITLTPAAIASAEAFGTAVLDTASRVFPAAIPSAESFGATRINTSVSLFPVSIASGESFGVAKLGFRIHIRHGVDMWVFVKEPTLLMDLWLMEEDE